MNYLAHAYLSFGLPKILVGNMISDYIKGKQIVAYEPEIQTGIILHRKIDAFTDAHQALIPAKLLFKPTYRLYAGAFVDVVLDYFLANKLKAEIDLMAFTQKTYHELATASNIFPDKFAKMFPSMRANNWLYHYQYDWGIEKSLTGLMRRAQHITEVETAYHIFNTNQTILQTCFDQFWPALFTYTENELSSLLRK